MRVEWARILHVKNTPPHIISCPPCLAYSHTKGGESASELWLMLLWFSVAEAEPHLIALLFPLFISLWDKEAPPGGVMLWVQMFRRIGTSPCVLRRLTLIICSFTHSTIVYECQPVLNSSLDSGEYSVKQSYHLFHSIFQAGANCVKATGSSRKKDVWCRMTQVDISEEVTLDQRARDQKYSRQSKNGGEHFKQGQQRAQRSKCLDSREPVGPLWVYPSQERHWWLLESWHGAEYVKPVLFSILIMMF